MDENENQTDISALNDVEEAITCGFIKIDRTLIAIFGASVFGLIGLVVLIACYAVLIMRGNGVHSASAEVQLSIAQEQSRAANADASKRMADAQIETQKRMTTLQMEVIKQCVDRKGVPLFLASGGVDCRMDGAAKTGR